MRRGLLCLVLFSMITAVTSCAVSAQNPIGTKGEVIIAKLSAPIYPMIARTAHVFGDVHVTLGVRQDGGIESAVATSGPSLLRQAALNSVRGSQFECRRCESAVTKYLIVYTFQLGPDPSCVAKETAQPNGEQQSYPQVIQSENHVTVVDRPFVTCDFGPAIDKVRSIKCLFLWKCAYHRF